MHGVTQACFGLSYLLAFGCELAGLRWPRPGLRWGAILLGAAGLLAHTIYLGVHLPSPAVPNGSFLLLAWVLAVFSLYGTIHHAKQAWAVFVLPVVIALVGVSVAYSETPTAGPSWLRGDRFAGEIHGVLLVLASIGISVGFVASAMYLVQARRVRKKRSPAGPLQMLSLERLEAMNRRALNTAVPLLTAGLVLGAVLLPQNGLENALSLKVLGTAGLWVVCVMLLVMRYAAHVPARRLARLGIVAFALLLLSLAAVHPFAEVR